MAKSDIKTRPADLYERDFHAWTENQASAIEAQHWSDIDATNLADEVRSLGRQLAREVADRVEILLSYLLKWRHLAEYRGMAWKENIQRQRHEMMELFVKNPSLAERRELFAVRAYENARRHLKYETYFFETDFPAACPFSVEQIFDESYFPEELDAPAIGKFPGVRSIVR